MLAELGDLDLMIGLPRTKMTVGLLLLALPAVTAIATRWVRTTARL